MYLVDRMAKMNPRYANRPLSVVYNIANLWLADEVKNDDSCCTMYMLLVCIWSLFQMRLCFYLLFVILKGEKIENLAKKKKIRR